jgi:hypothetical protein
MRHVLYWAMPLLLKHNLMGFKVITMYISNLYKNSMYFLQICN